MNEYLDYMITTHQNAGSVHSCQCFTTCQHFTDEYGSDVSTDNKLHYRIQQRTMKLSRCVTRWKPYVIFRD